MQGRDWLVFLMGRDQQYQRGPDVISYWDRIVIIVAIVGVTVAVLLVPGTYTLGNTLEGFVLLMALYASDRLDDSPYECASFGGAWALCIILIVGIVLINPIILWFVPFIIESLHVVGRAAQEAVAGQVTDGFTFLLALLLGIPMTRYRLRLLAERRKKQNNQGEEASKQASKESQQQVLPLQSSQAEGGVSGKEK